MMTLHIQTYVLHEWDNELGAPRYLQPGFTVKMKLVDDKKARKTYSFF